jgi:hypothetical protein
MRHQLSCLFTCVCVAAFSWAAPPHAAGIYSNLRFNSEGGDLLGVEIILIPRAASDSEYQAMVQIAEGGAPTAALVTATVHDSEITFRVPYLGKTPTFRGTITGTGLSGH